MIMAISDISIKKPVFAWMLMASLLIFGGISFMRMGISQLPDVDFPVVTIQVNWPGASPDVMESAVADIIEDAVMSIDGIQLVTSTSQQSQTQITIQFNLEQDINAALLQVQTKLSQAQKNLPQTIDPPIITKTNPSDQPIMWAALYSPAGKTIRELSLFVRDHLKGMITTVNGVGDVALGGYLEPQMRIWFNPVEMRKRHITSEDVIDAINDEHQLAPTGYQDKGPKETYVRVISEFRNAEECEKLFIPARKGEPNFVGMRIGEVAKCVEGTDEIRRISRYNGMGPAIGLGIIKQHGTNAVAIGEAVKEKLKNLQSIIPKGTKLEVVTDTTVFIKEAVKELGTTLLLSIFLTSIVCYLFLGTFSSALNVILAIPVSLIGSFIILNALGFTVNSFTLMGLSLSIGIVVDDAIMVLENISRHFEEGKNRVYASFVGAREITGAATAASIAVVAIFIPVIFMEGIVGKFFYQFGVTLSVAVMISLLEALTLAPMRTSQFLKIGKGNKVTNAVSHFMDWLAVKYKNGLRFFLNWRKTVLLITFAVFAASLFTVKFLRKEFLPPQDQSRFLVTLYTKMGSSIMFTDSVFKKVEALLKTRPEIDHYYVAVGGFGGGLVNQGISFITMKEKGERPFKAPFKSAPSQQEFMEYLRGALQKTVGVERASLLDLSLTGFSAQRGYPIEFVLQGPDWEKLATLSMEMRNRLKKSGLMSDVDSDYNPNMPELEIIPDRDRASFYGVPITNIANGIAATVGGRKLLPNKYTDSSGHRDDIQVKLDPTVNQGKEDLSAIDVRNVMGETVPLGNVVKTKEGKTLLTITRYNRERGISIFGNFKKGKSQSEVIEFVQENAKEILPPGYHVEVSGSSKAFQESFNSLLFALILGIAVSFMVLASQFNSFLHPMIILLALPFSVTGAFIAMNLTDTSLNIYSLIGLLLLMGIVKKNSILLVEFTNHKRNDGLSVNDALLEACPIRLRPILMTSIATIAGALPQAFALGAGAEVMRPMAVSVIGGVFLSTILTLFVVPCAYSLTARLESKKHEKELKEALQELNV
jgi:hydrophobe/amphiphile efflux-1 (HAE1) family protein